MDLHVGVMLGLTAGRQVWFRKASELHYPIQGLLCSKTRVNANDFSPGKQYLNPGFPRCV